MLCPRLAILRIKYLQVECDCLKAELDRDGCISCGLCPETCPEVFRMAEDGIAEVYVEEVPPGAEESAVEAQENCPVSVITVEE